MSASTPSEGTIAVEGPVQSAKKRATTRNEVQNVPKGRGERRIIDPSGPKIAILNETQEATESGPINSETRVKIQADDFPEQKRRSTARTAMSQSTLMLCFQAAGV